MKLVASYLTEVECESIVVVLVKIPAGFFVGSPVEDVIDSLSTIP
jgi:hypothetical protein